MKRQIIKSIFGGVACIGIFFVGLALGLIFVVIYPAYNYYHGSMKLNAQSIASEYIDAETETINAIRSPEMHILIYNSQKTCVQYIGPYSQRDSYNYEKQVEKLAFSYVKDTLYGSESFGLTKSFNDNGRPLNICMVESTPIYDGMNIIGAVVLIQLLNNVTSTYVGYIICFSVFYFVFVIAAGIYLFKTSKIKASQRNYVANVTHTLKTPIASVKSITEMLSEVDISQEQRAAYYGMIIQEVNHQGHTVQQILELSKLQDDSSSCKLHTAKASEILAPTIEKFSAICQFANIHFSVSEKIETLPEIYTNETYLNMLLETLLENAVKFVPDGGEIVLDVEESPSEAIFCLSDNGIGIKKEDLNHIFERFYKVNSDRNKNGSGLGLAIAKNIQERLNERIWVRSEPGVGSRFYFTAHFY